MVEEQRIRLALPFTDEDEISEVRSVLASGYLTQGPKVAEFEALVCARTGARWAFAMSSCTTALHLSLVVSGIHPGDEVLVPDFTFPAAANVVIQERAVPVLVDIHPETLDLDVEDAARKITSRTMAIMPMHPFGLAADMDPILELAKKHNLRVIEDAATAIGSTYKGRPCATMGDLGCFSFHPRKLVTTGEGGMILTNQDVIAEEISLLRSHGGIRREGRFRFEAAGYNYRLSDIQAAIGVAQMRKLDWLIARRRELAESMTEKLLGLEGVTVPVEPPSYHHVYQSYVVTLEDEVDRDAVIAEMHKQGIETTLGTYALHAQPFFERTYGYRAGDLPNSYRAYRQTLALPFYPSMEGRDIDRIVLALMRVLEHARSVRTPRSGDASASSGSQEMGRG